MAARRRTGDARAAGVGEPEARQQQPPAGAGEPADGFFLEGIARAGRPARPRSAGSDERHRRGAGEPRPRDEPAIALGRECRRATRGGESSRTATRAARSADAGQRAARRGVHVLPAHEARRGRMAAPARRWKLGAAVRAQRALQGTPRSAWSQQMTLHRQATSAARRRLADERSCGRSRVIQRDEESARAARPSSTRRRTCSAPRRCCALRPDSTSSSERWTQILAYMLDAQRSAPSPRVRPAKREARPWRAIAASIAAPRPLPDARALRENDRNGPLKADADRYPARGTARRSERHLR